ncbi:MAG TPA: dicarboxylate/amino acid:cation symporter [Lachnoclostridium sp.]|jgi:Na+/H+-dicarboxylate symporter|uniref:dicarboxylate/amino acid:cation symporter n=1 Tax=Lacrimispora sp. TaxID=2719234 RepID=UPI000ED615F2|nr:dicarboxylate/amino acid:cation symporter [Lacrimispora sp.]HCD43649.1 dicarboxylate/amino acid:cation symporter [Lachnoclostridium sp.]
MKKMKLSMTVQIMIGMAAGLLLGICFGDKVKDIKLLGDIFLRLIQMSVVVMIMGAVTESVAKLDPKELGRFGVKMLFWFLLTTVLAAAAGAAMGQFFLPGKGLSLPVSDQIVQTSDKGLYNIILDFLPSNIVQSMANSNMIQVIIFSVLFGASLGSNRINKERSQLMGVIKEFNEVILGIVHKVMNLAPLGIGALLAYTAGTTGIKVIMPLIKFLLIFGCGSLLYLGVMIAFVSFYCKTNPFHVGIKLCNMTIVAFTTTSSAVTLPTKMEDSEKKLGVSKKVSGIVNPLGMTLNSNGLSMFLALACITVSQIYGIPLPMPQLVRVIVLSTLACLGTVAVPGGGLVALATVIPALGLPLESIAFLSSIDWFSGMFRTILNVDIDALVAMLIAKDEKELDYGILNGNQ